MNAQGDGVQCLLCGDCIFSKYRHDFKFCKCKDAFVDGGFDYLRFGASDLNKVQVISRHYEKKKEIK